MNRRTTSSIRTTKHRVRQQLGLVKLLDIGFYSNMERYAPKLLEVPERDDNFSASDSEDEFEIPLDPTPVEDFLAEIEAGDD